MTRNRSAHLAHKPAKARNAGRADLPVEPLLRPGQVATILGVHINTVRNLRERGILPGVAIGTATRYRPADVRRLVEGQ